MFLRRRELVEGIFYNQCENSLFITVINFLEFFEEDDDDKNVILSE